MFDDDELLPISALQHLIYCERQCVLIHAERTWIDNCQTARGDHFHKRVDVQEQESRGDRFIARSVSTVSRQLGITGIADVVEFHRAAVDRRGAHLRGREGRWCPYPVEYKVGRPKAHHADVVQLCAHALCLEEQLDVEVSEGALYYGSTRRRSVVRFDAALRRLTGDATRRLRSLLATRATPLAVFGNKCKGCSLLPACLPNADRSAIQYVARELQRLGSKKDPG